MNNTLELIKERYTTGQTWETPKDYKLIQIDTVTDYPVKYNNKDCKMAVEINKVIYEGRKKKAPEYSQVIEINVYDNEDCATDFKTIRMVSKNQYTCMNGMLEIL